MKTIPFLTVFFIYTASISQTQFEDQSSKEHLKLEQKKQETENKKFQNLAEERVITLQKKLNLNGYTCYRIKKAIIKYSIQANKVLQSNISTKEKTKSLSNIIYFQNEELKKVLTVHQFYQYINLNKDIN